MLKKTILFVSLLFTMLPFQESNSPVEIFDAQLPAVDQSGLMGNKPDDPPGKAITIPVMLRDAKISPSRIVLPVGRRATIEVFNIGSQPQDFAIGRQVLSHPDGYPMGYEKDFFRGGRTFDTRGGGSCWTPAEIQQRVQEIPDEFWMDRASLLDGGHPWEYQGFMFVMPADYARTAVRRHQEVFIDNGLRPHSYCSFTFQVNAGMQGAWEFATFAREGEFYRRGARGVLKIVHQDK